MRSKGPTLPNFQLAGLGEFEGRRECRGDGRPVDHPPFHLFRQKTDQGLPVGKIPNEPLEPFQRINPCGYEGLKVTSMAELLPGRAPAMDEVGEGLLSVLAENLAKG